MGGRRTKWKTTGPRARAPRARARRVETITLTGAEDGGGGAGALEGQAARHSNGRARRKGRAGEKAGGGRGGDSGGLQGAPTPLRIGALSR